MTYNVFGGTLNPAQLWHDLQHVELVFFYDLFQYKNMFLKRFNYEIHGLTTMLVCTVARYTHPSLPTAPNNLPSSGTHD